MVYTRGLPADYDNWAQSGLPRLVVRRACCRISSAPSATTRGADEFHGGDGPLRVSRPARREPALRRVHRRAGAQAGFPLTGDFNGARAGGLRPLRLHHRRRRALEQRARLPRPGARAGPTSTSSRARTRCAIVFDGPARRRRRAPRCAARRATSRRARDHPVRRRGQLAAAADALGHRRCGRAARARHPRRRRPQGVGTNLQDHLLVRVEHACTAADHPALASAARPRLRSLVAGAGVQARPGHPLPARGRRLHALAIPRSTTPDLQSAFPARLSTASTCAAGPARPALAHRGHGFFANSTSCGPRAAAAIALRRADPRARAGDPRQLSRRAARPRVLREGVQILRTVFAQAAFDPLSRPRARARARRAERRTRSTPGSAAPPTPCSIRSAPAAWAGRDAVVDAQLRVQRRRGPARRRRLGHADASRAPTPMRRR